MRVCTARVNLTNRHQAQRRGELQVPRYRGHAGAAARNGRGFSAKLRRLGGVLFVFLSALLTGFPAQADSMLFGNSPALPRSQAVLSLGEDAINWSSTDEQLGVVDTGRIVPQVWRQFRSQSVFQYRETSLRLYGRVRSFGGKLTAVVDVVYDGRRARYLLEQLVQTSEENANSSYPPATADPEGGRKSVEGIVTHALTEVPIEGATVSVGGRSATTDNEGMYRILNVAPGTYEVAASRDDFVTSRLQAKIGSCGSSYDSSYDCGAEVVSLTLTPRPANPQEPAITAVRRQYEGIFLKNISVNNRYEVSVAWQGTPGSVKFKIDGDEYVVAGGPNGASRSFDMGQDFPGSLAPRGTALTITAVNGEGVESAPRVLYPIVIPIPAWSVELGLWDLVAGGGPGGLDYELGTEFPDPALEGTTQVPRFVPIFGGDKIGIDETQIFGGLGFSGTSAQGTITAGGKTGFSAGTASIAGSLKGTGTLKYQPNVGLVWVKAQADLEISGTIKPPPVPVSDLIVPGSGFIARVIRPILRAEITSEFGPTITADVVLVQQNNEVAFESSEFSGAVAVKIALVLSAGPAELSFYGGGSSKIVILFAEPPPPSLLKQIMLRLYAGIQARLWIFSGKVEAAYTWTYPAGSSAQVALLAEVNTDGNVEFRPIQPDFLDHGPYSLFMPAMQARSAAVSADASVAADDETVLVGNVYPFATPAIAERAGGRLVTFVYYDPDKDPVQATDIHYTWFDGAAWSTPAPIVDDTRAEFAPQLAVDRLGRIVAVWERVKDPAFAVDDVEAMVPLMEIVYAVYTPATDSWTQPLAITDNTILDHSPRLTANQDGDVLLVWEQNAGNQPYGDAADPSAILYAIWDGAAWTAPATVIDTVAGAFDFDTAFWSGGGLLAWSGDTDGAIETVADREIFYSILAGASWSPAQRLTNNALADTAPQVVGTAANAIQLLWQRGGEYVELTDLAGSYRVVREAPGSEMNSPQLTIGPGGQPYLIWQALSEDRPDVFYRVKSPDRDQWGEDVRLTDDEGLEKNVSVAVDSAGELHLVFSRAATVFETLVVDTAEGPVEVPEVPQAGQHDLIVLGHAAATDISAVSGSFALSEENPDPAADVGLTLAVRNAGDTFIDAFQVAFYDGDPNAGGTEIANVLVNELLAPGATTDVEATWVAPGDNLAHLLYAVIDPADVIAESDEANNTAFLRGLLPDVFPAQTRASWRGADTVDLVAAIANNGAATAAGVAIELRKDAPDGAVLDREVLVSLPARGLSEVPFTWTADAESLQQEDIILYVVTDPDGVVPEYNEDNNSAWQQVLVP